MQCNDYFYSRYFGSLFALSGMTPYWPTDYLCGCCHTWLLQLPSLSPRLHLENLPLLLLHLHLFIPLSLSFNSGLHVHFLWSLCLPHLHHLLISSFLSPPQSLHLYSSTIPRLAPLTELPQHLKKHALTFPTGVVGRSVQMFFDSRVFFRCTGPQKHGACEILEVCMFL